MSKTAELILSHYSEEECEFRVAAEEINREIADKLGFDAQFKLIEIGSFDSPGYELHCSAFAFVDEEGKLHMHPIKKEWY